MQRKPKVRCQDCKFWHLKPKGTCHGALKKDKDGNPIKPFIVVLTGCHGYEKDN